MMRKHTLQQLPTILQLFQQHATITIVKDLTTTTRVARRPRVGA